MNAVDTRLNQFLSELQQVQDAKQKAIYLEGKFNQDFTAWLKEQGVPENTSLPAIIQHFREKKSTLIHSA